MPLAQSTSLQASKKRQRSREPDWNNFYKNGLPKEVIVIDDSPEPHISESVEPDSNGLRNINGAANGAALRHAAKKRKRDDMYDPIYHIKAGPSETRSPHYKNSNTSSTISTDRTTSAIQTTAATSLGSQYSANGSRGYLVDDTQIGQKRKRIATRQQIANEAKRRDIEINGDAFSNYRPPPRPPIKAPEVNVKVMPDVSLHAFGIGVKLTLYRTHTPKTAK
jgi:dual-specificity kinase